jgi:pyrimidine deaminase RibD-like protein
MMDDLLHMRAALALARRGLGNAWPNPAVGCVLVKDGRVIGRGWTQPGAGKPRWCGGLHTEVVGGVAINEVGLVGCNVSRT